MQHLGYDTCVLADPLRTEFFKCVLCLVHNAISGWISTPIMLVFSGIGNEESLVFRDGRLCLALLFDVLRCIPVEIPIMLVFDCVDFCGVKKMLQDPFQGSQRERLVSFAKRPNMSLTLFDFLQTYLPTSFSLTEVIQSCNGHLVDKPTVFKPTSLFSSIKLWELQRSLPGKTMSLKCMIQTIICYLKVMIICRYIFLRF